MTGGLVGGLIAFVVAAVLMGVMVLARAGRPVERQGRLIFTYGLPLKILSAVLLFGPLIGITVLVIVFPPKKDGDIYAIAGCYALFGCLGLPLFWEMMRFALVIDDDGLTCHSPWRGQFYIAWPEVRELTWTTMGSYFIIKGEHRWFRVSQMTAGLSAMLAEFEKRLPPEKMRGTMRGYAVAGRTFPGGEILRRAPREAFDLKRWSESRRRDEGPGDRRPKDGRDDIQRGGG